MTYLSVLCAGNASGSSWCGCRWCGLCCEPAREIWHSRQSCFWGIIWEQSNSSSVCSQGVRYTHATTPHHSHLHRLVHASVSGELLIPLCRIHPGKFVEKFCPDTVSFFVSTCGKIFWYKLNDSKVSIYIWCGCMKLWCLTFLSLLQMLSLVSF